MQGELSYVFKLEDLELPLAGKYLERLRAGGCPIEVRIEIMHPGCSEGLVDYFTIETEAQYDAALARAWGLMDAEPGSRDEELLSALAEMIGAYERIHYPMDATA